ncbi:MAG TPA: two-component regulator propeller domain-containing protein, partial [Chitinophagales bacterium]|nr:two-component regulator propeller domain-containing protein [Chitinophagales bacterium]
MKPLTPLLLYLLLFSPALHSQNTSTRHLKYETLTINDGLSQGLVNCMLQDRYGFMWFGTKDGLNRYDGYRFTIFRNDSRDEHSIGGNFIQTLFEDSRGRLWVGTLNNGLDIFERETETFIHF